MPALQGYCFFAFKTLDNRLQIKGNKKANQFKEELEAKGYQIELVNNSHNNFIKFNKYFVAR